MNIRYTGIVKESVLSKKPKSQLNKFKAAAREAECDMDEKSFDEALGKLAKSEPPPKDQQKTDKEEPAD